MTSFKAFSFPSCCHSQPHLIFISTTSVGKFLLSALLHPHISRNATLIVHSFTATPRQILAEYERQTNSTWTISYTSVEQLRELERNAYQVHHSIATVTTLRRIWTEGGTLYKFYDDHSLLESVQGDEVQLETLESQVAESIKRQLIDPGDEMNNPLRRLSTS